VRVDRVVKTVFGGEIKQFGKVGKFPQLFTNTRKAANEKRVLDHNKKTDERQVHKS
jgi:hypothetical protein